MKTELVNNEAGVSTFDAFASAIAGQFQRMTETGLFRTDVPRDDLWATYLASFPPGADPLFKKRTEHDCSCCRHFVKTLGGVVTIVDGKVVTLWDVVVEAKYQPVVDALATRVREATIENVFIHPEPTVGTAKSFALMESGQAITWKHFFVNMPMGAYRPKKTIGPFESEMRSTFDVMLRGLREITRDATDTVLDLIAQNSLYRGEEHEGALKKFRELQHDLHNERSDQLFVWSRLSSTSPAIARIRNTAIGTLLIDLSNDVDLEDAVKAFERVVAPTNYKRPTALVTKAMIKKAKTKIEELGLLSSLERRYATIEDITVNNVLFADRSARVAMNVFDELATTSPVDPKQLGHVEDVTIAAFLANVLPKAETIDVFFENRHAGNLVSLIAPSDPTARLLFKWPNGFSWSYAGELTDSIKERVKRAGGNVTGDFRASLSWHCHDDLDLHLVEPNGSHIFYMAKRALSGGFLDVDMNAGGGTTREPVENIAYQSSQMVRTGVYKLYVNQFVQREPQLPGFELELEFLGTRYSFAYSQVMRTGQDVPVATFKVEGTTLTILESLPHAQTSRTLWNVPTQAFVRSNIVMLSPNHWDERTIGNRHYFFMLDGCRNAEKARGFFNEFLSEELTPHRKVLEVVGAKMRTDESDRQLSGLGFSSTQRNSVLVRVKGAFTRIVNVTF